MCIRYSTSIDKLNEDKLLIINNNISALQNDINYPISNSRCEASSAIDIIDTTNGCLVDRSGSSGVRTNLNEYRDVRAELDRVNMFVFLNHEMNNGNEAFFELGYYDSETNY